MTDADRRLQQHMLDRAMRRLCKHNYDGTLTDHDVYEVIRAYEAIHGHCQPEEDDEW